MNMWFSSHFLVVGLFLSSSALTPEECQPLITPLSLVDPSMMYGRTNFIMGYTDNDVFNTMLKSTESSWMKITPIGPKELLMSQMNKINGTCFASKANATIDGNTATTSLINITSTFHILPSCEGCLIFSINSTARNFDKWLDLMKFNSAVKEEFTARTLYLMGSNSTLTDSDLERFKQQASCLGFSREPDFHYDPKKGFCVEGEGSRMSVVMRAVLLLLVAAISTNAVPGPEDCDGLNKTLPTKDLHKIFGDWVLVWSVSEDQKYLEQVRNLSSSHVALQLLPDNKTIEYNERNMFLEKSCTQYLINVSMPSDASDSDHHTLHTVAATVEKDGVVSLFNDSGKLDFYESCSDCLVMVYRGEVGRFLLIYRREGQHQDVEELKAAHSDHKKLAECLGFPHDEPFIYDGAADFCHKKSSDCDGLNKTLPTKDLHKIFGDWVLVWTTSDHQQGSDLLVNLVSSHVELQLLPDNKTIVYNERNMLLDMACSQYLINMSMPSDPSDSEHHTLHIVAATVEKDGVVSPYIDSADVDFYESCSDCLVMVYRGKLGRFLLIYRREGQHRDVEQLKAAHSDHKKLAECLGFPHDEPFIYDGAADFCHKKSSPAVEPEQS
ncbi:saxitoxin and tetrodotoxin-binding protein 1-like [Enoplosus armatus]|uniref:saxitoxin and tetrodotoxin-binding protein 1-like n=1 Tax=Enoplosus armatus TaxID=215367 RepID=UPI0039954D99